MKQIFTPTITIYLLQALAKCFSVFDFVLLPIFYAERFINAAQVGYIGATFLVMLIIGALLVAKWFHQINTKELLKKASLLSFLAAILVLISSLLYNLPLLIVAYICMGLAVGISMAGLNNIAAQQTKRGDRYAFLAKIAILTDIVRIVFPLVMAGAILIGAITVGIDVIIVFAAIFAFGTLQLPSSPNPAEENMLQQERIIQNKPFLYILSIEFLDSLASSQLFVFLPILFLAKGYSLGGSILFQSIIFAGYMAGRVFVSYLAKKFSGIQAVAYAELAMAIIIVFLILVNNLSVLYMLCFFFGVFARGTSPAIKALSFDSLSDNQMKQGSALHVVAGDSGSALGQLLFGILIAYLGINSPFIAAAIVVSCISFMCFIAPLQSIARSRYINVHG